MPAGPGGIAVTPTGNLNPAAADFKKALELTTNAESKVSYNLALARAYHQLGDKTNAVAFATAAITGSPDFVRFICFDNPQALTNEMELAVFDRNTFDDLQLLPRLDFLDPKYHGTGPTDYPIAIQKLEEAHLILAEAALANNSLNEAKTHMKNALAVVNARDKETIPDVAEGRTESAPNSRPNKADILVAASPTDAPRAGLVLDRQATSITVPVISGTSVSAADIDLNLNIDVALETLYLMRQEIFIAEGRRMIDLDIKFLVSEIESLSNTNITTAQTTGYVPAFIPKVQLDAFTYNAATKTAIIAVNVNKVLITNKTSPDVLPFH